MFLQGVCEIIPCILIMFFENEEIDILAKEKYSTTEKKYLDNDNDNKVFYFYKAIFLGGQS